MKKTVTTPHNLMAEAISFISAALGEPYTTAQGQEFFWSACSLSKGYPVVLEDLGNNKVNILVRFLDIHPRDNAKLYAIYGWARLHGTEAGTD